jgi:hypothetical protein
VPNNINDIIKNRRSHFPKEFSGKILEEEIIRTCLENGHWAPSHKLTLPWRFVVMNKAAVLTFYELAKTDYLNHTIISDQKKLDKLNMMSEKTSHIIGIVCKPSGIVPLWEEQASCAMAIQNMYLSLSQFSHAGGYWSTGLRTNMGAMRDYMECQPGDIHMGNFILGHLKAKREIASRPNLNLKVLVK